jgi:hypothetical protein
MSKLSNIHSIIAELDDRKIKTGSEIFISGGERGTVVNQTPDNFKKAGEVYSRTSPKVIYKVTHSRDNSRVGTTQAQHNSRIYLKESVADVYSNLYSELDDTIRHSAYRRTRQNLEVSEYLYNNWIQHFFRTQSIVPIGQVGEVIAQFKKVHPLSDYTDAPVTEGSSIHVGEEESKLFTKVYSRTWDRKYGAIAQYRGAIVDAINRASGYGGDMDMAELVDLYIKQYPFVVTEGRSESTRTLTAVISQVQDIIVHLMPRSSIVGDVRDSLRDVLDKLDRAYSIATRLTEDDLASGDDEDYIDEDEEALSIDDVPPTGDAKDEIHPHRELEQPEEVKPNLDWISNFDLKEIKSAIDDIVGFLATCDDDTQIELLRNDIRILDNLSASLKANNDVDQHWEIATQQGSCEHLHPEFVSKMHSVIGTRAVHESHTKKKAATFGDHREWTDTANTREMDIKPGKGDFEGAYCGTSGKLMGMWRGDKGWLAPAIKEGMDATTYRITDDAYKLKVIAP